VTGGAGFIGSHVCELLLEQDWEVTVVDDLSTGKVENVPDAANLVTRSCSEIGVIADLEPEVVFHLAAQTDVPTSVADPIWDAVANIIGTIAVLEEARSCGARVVFSSSGGAIYGECIGAASETDDLDPVSPYAVSKLAGEAYLRAWNRLHGMENVVLRYANVYGPRQLATLEGGVVAIFLERILAREPVTIYGDGEQVRDYVYVGDVARATVAAADFPAGTYNVATGEPISVQALLGALLIELGVHTATEIRYQPARPGDLLRSCLSPAKLRDLTSRDHLPLALGLSETVEWARRISS
jgi:UDP-glucose 4-epimerase